MVQVGSPTTYRPQIATSSRTTQSRGQTVASWRQALRQHLGLLPLLLIAALVHGINMFNYPYYHDDEGTYMAQAWAVITHGQLANYTYWYDHAPAGWIQIAVFSKLVGGFYAFGTAVDTGRVLMLILQIASTFLVYKIALAASQSKLAASIATLFFAVSPYGIYWHRRVTLDNIAVFWMLLAILLLLLPRFSLSRVWLSAFALAISILSKEVTLVIVPALAYLVAYRSHKSQRLFATIGWLTIVAMLVSLYILMAVLKWELFPFGSLLGGATKHVSMLETLQWQSARGKDGGLIETGSQFWRSARVWSQDEPILVWGGTISALIALVTFVRWRIPAILGLTTLLSWLFIARGGIVNEHFLVPILPLLAINLGLLIGKILEGLRALWQRLLATRISKAVEHTPATTFLMALALIIGCVLGATAEYIGPKYQFGYVNNPSVLWTAQQTGAQKEAVSWVEQNLPADSAIIMDHSMWTDLHDIPGRTDVFQRAHYYYKVDRDEEISVGVFHNTWHTADYVITTPTLIEYAGYEQMQLVLDAIKNSTPVARFDTGGYPIEIRRVNKLHEAAATTTPLLIRTWATYKTQYLREGRVLDPASQSTTSSQQAAALWTAVYMDDRAAFDSIWRWTQTNLQVRGDGLFARIWQVGGDQNTGAAIDGESATAADQDIALALLFASKRWQSTAYSDAAGTVIQGIWQSDTLVLVDRRLVVAGSWAQGNGPASVDGPVVSIDALAPYAYRIFAEADPAHPWGDLVDSSYAMLGQYLQTPHPGNANDTRPRWIALDPVTGSPHLATAVGTAMIPSPEESGSVAYRLTIDWLWFQDNRAKEAIAALNLPQPERTNTPDDTLPHLAITFALDGAPEAFVAPLAQNTGAVGALLLSDPTQAFKLYADKILGTYREQSTWGRPNNLNDQIWGWNATALLNGSLGNLWAGQQLIPWQEVLPEALP